MVKNKKDNVKKIKKEKYRSDEQQEIIRFVKILLIVIVFVLIVYFATRIFVKKDLGDAKKETNVTEIDYSKTIFGTMLNKLEDEYYVMAYSSANNKANYYGALKDKYSIQEGALSVYFIDLKDGMNKKYIATDGKSNNKASQINELKVGEITLFKIENKKITKYIESVEEIKKEFSID